MTFEDFDYVDMDYDDNTFTIYKNGHEYTYDIGEENELYSRIMDSDVEKYEVYSQEDEFFREEDEDKSIEDEIHDLWKELEEI